jgi:hypothetical protein
MPHRLTLTDAEYAALAADAATRGQPVESVLHELLAERYPALSEPPLSPAAAEEARQMGLDPNKMSALGRKLFEIRTRGIQAGVPRISTWEELDAEIADRRGGNYPDVDA